MAGWNFFFYKALLIPFDITAVNMVISFGETMFPLVLYVELVLHYTRKSVQCDL